MNSIPPPQKISFGQLPDGRPVEAFTLHGTDGFAIEVLTYGGVVRRILAPDRNGELEDVVLGYRDLDGYLNDKFFMGATVGRIAGRVSNGELKLGAQDYRLPINDPPNHLHGGPEALNTKVWQVESLENGEDAQRLTLSYTSPDGEQGYPGTVTLRVVYTVTPNNDFIYETFAEADRETPVSLAHHSYFNLSGEGMGTVFDHEGQIFSEQTAASDESMTLLDRLESVSGRPADLRSPKRLGEVIPHLWQRHGDLYWLGSSGEMKNTAHVIDPRSGRTLSLQTTNSCLQTYFGADLNGFQGKSDRIYEPFGAFCLECQGYPQATNVEGFGDIIVRPGKGHRHKAIYTFANLS